MKNIKIFFGIIALVLLITIIFLMTKKKESFKLVQGIVDNVTRGGDKKIVLSDNDGNFSSIPSYDGLVPQGSIIAWSGTDIPRGWAFCDGKTYDRTTGAESTATTSNDNKITTPDLRGRFIVGYKTDNTVGLKINLGDTGGEENHVLTIDEMPSHDHPISGMQWGPGPGYSGGDNEIGGSATMGKRGGGLPHNNMPPFYALVYIMKL